MSITSNPAGVTGNLDRIPMHPYFVFKDLVTIFFFFLALSVIIFYYPNLLGQPWPTIMFIIVNIIYACAISWKYTLFKVKIYNSTILVSGFYVLDFLDKKKEEIFYANPYIVRNYYKVYNQQITKVIIVIKKILLLLVGISETIRTQKSYISNIKKNSHPLLLKFANRSYSTISSYKDSHIYDISLEFKQWFAGITDGAGSLCVNKNGEVNYEITLPFTDERTLRIIQNKFGGSIKARSGVKSVRYRTKNKETVTKIIHCLNGLTLNNIRLSQLNKACLALNIPIKEPIKPSYDSAYLAGLLDSDGYLNLYFNQKDVNFNYHLTISILSKSRCNLEFILEMIGGHIYYEKSQNGIYFWKANSKLLHLKLYDYFSKFPPKTIKKHKTYLIKEFHFLNDLKCYRNTDKLSMEFKMWKNFISKWENKN